MKASSRMNFKPFGREILVNFVQPSKAFQLISVMPSGITSSPDTVSLQEVRVSSSTVIRPAFRYSSQDFGSFAASGVPVGSAGLFVCSGEAVGSFDGTAEAVSSGADVWFASSVGLMSGADVWFAASVGLMSGADVWFASSVGLLSGDLLGTAAVVPVGFGTVLAEAAGTLDVFGAEEAVVTGAEEAVPAAAFTVTLMTHFFMLFAETVTFAAPAFLPVMRIFFFTALTFAIFLLEILTFNLLFLVFFAFTVTVFPMDTVTLVLLTLILAAA